MANRFRKSDIEFHSEGYGRRNRPAVNVKVYHFQTDWKVADTFHCSEEIAQQALNFSFESAQSRFWEDAQDRAEEIWGRGVKVYSEGRSGGWLIVDGIGEDVESWDAIAVSQWGRLVRWCETEIEFLNSWDYVREDIEANRWAEEGAGLYNFYEYKSTSGEVVNACIVDLRNRAAEVLTTADLPVKLLLKQEEGY